MNVSPEEVCPTEDTVLALLDFLVDPLLPSKCLSNEPPLQEDLVAKQVHAVVLLYNYYHRKQNPGLEFLDFISFCKLAVARKPSLESYMKLMKSSDYGELELDNLDKHMSLTEKEITNACDVSKSLDVSHDEPVIEGWPISQVAVFLVDKKENCFLFHSSITQGVWSLIEKEVTLPGEDGYGNKKKRVIKKTPKENQIVDEAVLRKVAYTAVREACAFNQGDLKILETHMVYSTSKPNTAVRLYIMQCTQSNQDLSLVPISDALESLQGPLIRKECGSWLLTPVIEYFHLLPFADKLSNWLPRYREILENGTQHVEAAETEELPSPPHNSENVKEFDNGNSYHLNEKLVVNSSGSVGEAKEARNSNNRQSKQGLMPFWLHQSEEEQAVRNGNSGQSKEKNLPSVTPLLEPAKDVRTDSASNLKKELLPCMSNHSGRPTAVEDNCGSRPKDMPTEPVVYKKRNRSQKNISSNSPGSKNTNATKGHLRQDEEFAVSGSSSSMDVHETFRTCPAVDGMRSNFSCTDRTDDQKQIIVVQEPNQSAFMEGAIVMAENLDTTYHKHKAEKFNSDQDEKQERTIVSFDSNPEYLRKVQLTIASKEDLLSQTALRVLFRKRERLSQQLRSIADEIALCDRNIEIIKKGGKDDLAVIMDSVLDGCNELCRSSSATENKMGLNFEDQDMPPLKRKRISEASLSLHDPCRDLDNVCNENSWTLPTFTISTLEGGFQASVTVKGSDFDCSSEGTMYPTPQEARRSAASVMLARIRSMIVET